MRPDALTKASTEAQRLFATTADVIGTDPFLRDVASAVINHLPKSAFERLFVQARTIIMVAGIHDRPRCVYCAEDPASTVIILFKMFGHVESSYHALAHELAHSYLRHNGEKTTVQMESEANTLAEQWGFLPTSLSFLRDKPKPQAQT